MGEREKDLRRWREKVRELNANTSDICISCVCIYIYID